MEDHAPARSLLVLLLTHLGHWVESAGDADAALERMRQDGFDMLVTDLWLPDGHGRDLLRELRAHDLLPPYVVSVDAIHRKEAMQRSKEAGCCAHLDYPIHRRDVEAALQSICVAAG